MSITTQLYKICVGLACIFLVSCVSEKPLNQDNYSKNIPNETTTHNDENEGVEMLNMTVNGNKLIVKTEDNPTVKALLTSLSKDDLSIEMKDYGGFEKVGPLGFTLKAQDLQLTSQPGDLFLYQGNQLVIFYDSNAWTYTRIGKIQNVSQSELKEILGDGDVSIKLSIHEE